jgi:superfamily II DNA or RNA helicase
MSFTVGSLVKARGREWVVLPGSTTEYMMLRPLGGSEDETTAIHTALESVESASFGLPDPSAVGDARSCRLLRNAVLLSSQSGAGPFRSISRIAVEPRPYQFVPLLMSLKLDPVRICIADDVGIGKTIEACLIARELLDRGEIERIAVLSPPHLAEQWQSELIDKFHMQAELVTAGTASRLERTWTGESLFEHYPFVVVSMDFIKSERRRDEFVRTCPELVIVDEAHTCAFGFEGKGSKHQRHELVKRLSENPKRHMILVTATPHSGKSETFRSLLAFLKKDFAELPDDLGGKENEHHRRNLAVHFVQRRRKDIEHFMQDTLFPARSEAEETYKLSAEYAALFNKALAFARRIVKESEGISEIKRRVRWWSVLALLRALGSSPAAAAATLRERAKASFAGEPEEADELGRDSVFDVATDDETEGVDIIPGSDFTEEAETSPQDKEREMLLAMARDADKLNGKLDEKLMKAARLIIAMVKQGSSPMVFCRFIATAEYVGSYLKKEIARLVPDCSVVVITGTLPPEDRKARIEEIDIEKPRVLVCTDCLSEGLNLQTCFNAVFHYDLSWSPTRHEQREGRVDRFNQKAKTVNVLTYYSTDNQIDGIILDVLLRKHRKIRMDLGISVPVPIDTTKVTEAIFEGLLLRESVKEATVQLVFDFMKPQADELYIEWDNAANREKRSRTMFAQEPIQKAVNDELPPLLEAAKKASGGQDTVKDFCIDSFRFLNGSVVLNGDSAVFNFAELPIVLKDQLAPLARSKKKTIKAAFDIAASDGAVYIGRTHPLVDALATFIMESAFDSQAIGGTRRAGAITTGAVKERTTILLVRFRYDLVTKRTKEQSELVEECALLAFAGSPENPRWLSESEATTLLDAEPAANTIYEKAAGFVRKVTECADALVPGLEREAKRRADELLGLHTRVREAAKMKGITYSIEPKLPADILGIYICLPLIQAQGGQA